MSKKGDFLSGFSGGNTQKPLTEQNSKPVKETTSPEKEVKKETPSKTDVNATKVDVTKVAVADNKKLADKIVADAEKKDGKASSPTKPAGTSTAPIPGVKSSGTATRPAQSSSAIIKAPEHVVTKDDTFHKRKMAKYGIIGVVTIVIAIIGFFIFRMSNMVEVPNFVGRDIEDPSIRLWVANNGPINQEEDYSIEFAAGEIMAQNREPGDRMPRRSAINVTVSRGPNMNEIIELPDFETMTRAQIRTWQDENAVRGVRPEEEHHPDIEANHVIRVEFASTADPENFRRSDSVTIVYSRGPETIQIGNLVGDDPEDVAEFIAENPQITVELEYEPHPTIDRGYVLRQSVNPGTRLAVGETLVLTLSAGQPVEVPNFANMRMIEVQEMADDPTSDLNIDFRHVYHDSIQFGRFISQSVEPGTEVYGENATVVVTFSRWRPWIENRVSSTYNGLVQEFVEMNNDGSFLYVDIRYVNHYEDRGTIVRQSHYGQHVPLNQRITFDVSLGNQTRPTDPPMAMPPGDDD